MSQAFVIPVCFIAQVAKNIRKGCHPANKHKEPSKCPNAGCPADTVKVRVDTMQQGAWRLHLTPENIKQGTPRDGKYA